MSKPLVGIDRTHIDKAAHPGSLMRNPGVRPRDLCSTYNEAPHPYIPLRIERDTNSVISAGEMELSRTERKLTKSDLRILVTEPLPSLENENAILTTSRDIAGVRLQGYYGRPLRFTDCCHKSKTRCRGYTRRKIFSQTFVHDPRLSDPLGDAENLNPKPKDKLAQNTAHENHTDSQHKAAQKDD